MKSNSVMAYETRLDAAESCVDMELLSIKHRNKTADPVQEYYIHRDRNNSDHLQVYTDGSRDPLAETTGAAVVIPTLQTGVSRRMSDCLSVYVVELCAVLRK